MALGMGQGTSKMNQEDLTGPESRGVPEKKLTKATVAGVCHKGHRSRLEEIQWPKLERFEQNKVSG